MLRREKSQVSTLERSANPTVARQRQFHLSEDAQAEIVRRNPAGELQRELADAFGVIERRLVPWLLVTEPNE